MTDINLTNFTQAIYNNVNDPNCALSVGAVGGMWFTFKYIVILAGIYIIMKAVDKLAIEPILEWIKKKIWRKSK
jgi:hypothetical protein